MTWKTNVAFLDEKNESIVAVLNRSLKATLRELWARNVGVTTMF